MRLLLCLCIAISTAASQRLEFDVAAVKLSPTRDAVNFTVSSQGGPGSDTPTAWSCQYYDLRDLLGKAYDLKAFQISGPAWLDQARFHIEARMPQSITRQQFREMLRNLLIDRFALAAHLESRIAPRYELSVAPGGPKLPKPVERPVSRPTAIGIGADGYPTLGPPTRESQVITIHNRTRLFFPDTPIADLAEELTYKLNQPVIDRTGLPGKYDIGLYWGDDDPGLDLKAALRDQLGLRLEEKKGPLTFLLVDYVEKLPTGNE
jgi:uncharacterized protein (TIGR03435 family)